MLHILLNLFIIHSSPSLASTHHNITHKYIETKPRGFDHPTTQLLIPIYIECYKSIAHPLYFKNDSFHQAPNNSQVILAFSAHFMVCPLKYETWRQIHVFQPT